LQRLKGVAELRGTHITPGITAVINPPTKYNLEVTQYTVGELYG